MSVIGLLRSFGSNSPLLAVGKFIGAMDACAAAKVENIGFSKAM